MTVEIFLVNGTYQELLLIAQKKKIDPEKIRLVNCVRDIQGFRTGVVILGLTGPNKDVDDIFAYIRTHWTIGETDAREG
jgi:hypothetical protein